MNAERWNRLQDQARWILEHADQSSPREVLQGMALQLRLWQYPRSGDHVSWSIILPVRDYRGRKTVVREISWDRRADWKQGMTALKSLKRRPLLEPSIHVRDAELDWADLAPFLDAAGRLPMGALAGVPLAASEEDACGLEGYRSLAHIRLAWLNKGPRGWGGTIAWFSRFRRLLIRAMRERESEGTSR